MSEAVQQDARAITVVLAAGPQRQKLIDDLRKHAINVSRDPKADPTKGFGAVDGNRRDLAYRLSTMVVGQPLSPAQIDYFEMRVAKHSACKNWELK